MVEGNFLSVLNILASVVAVKKSALIVIIIPLGERSFFFFFLMFSFRILVAFSVLQFYCLVSWVWIC